MKGVDLERLDALLASIGWTRAQMERAIGEQIDERTSPETKLLIWQIINDAGARRALTAVRLHFPGAVISAIREDRGPR